MTLSIDDAWREAAKLVEAYPTAEARRWFDVFSRMDGLLRQIAELPFVKDDPTANRIMESFANCGTMEELSDRIDLLLDHVQGLFRTKMLAEGRDPGPGAGRRRRAVLPQEQDAGAEFPADERRERTVLKL